MVQQIKCHVRILSPEPQTKMEVVKDLEAACSPGS
jgi:hypothetical protein